MPRLEIGSSVEITLEEWDFHQDQTFFVHASVWNETGLALEVSNGDTSITISLPEPDSIAKQMALAVLRGDDVAALALADKLINKE